MNLKSLIVAAVATASIVPAFAEPQFVDVSNVRSGKSRAEVLADLEAYQASGLADQERRIYVEWTSPQYERARRIYAGMLASDSFKQRVAAIAKQRGEAPVSAAINDTPNRAQ